MKYADASHDEQNAAVVGAIRLAFEAAANAESQLAMVRALVDAAPPTPDDDTLSVVLLVDKIRDGEWGISTP